MEQGNREKTFVSCMSELDEIEHEEARLKDQKKDLFSALRDAHFNPGRVREFRRRIADADKAAKRDEEIDEMAAIWDRRSSIKRAGTPVALHARAPEAAE